MKKKISHHVLLEGGLQQTVRGGTPGCCKHKIKFQPYGQLVD